MDSMAQIDIGGSKPFWMLRFQKVSYKQQKVAAQIIASQDVQKAISSPYFKMISTPSRLNKSCPDQQNDQNCLKTSKLKQKQPKYFPQM